MAARRSTEGDILTDVILQIFRLNGRLLEVADQITEGSGLTAARWQVLGGVLPEPLPVAQVARNMGLTRQSVQRLADVLVEEGLCEYRDNPAHQRAKLLAPTEQGWAAIKQIHPRQVAWANRVSAAVGAAKLRDTRMVLDQLIAILATPQGAVSISGVAKSAARRVK